MTESIMHTTPSIFPQSVGSSLFLFLSFSVLLASGTIDNAQLSDGVSTRFESRRVKEYVVVLFHLRPDKKNTHTQDNILFSSLFLKYTFQEKDLTSSNQTENTIFNASLIEEDRFNVTEHRGFIHGFVEALSVILVSQYLLTYVENMIKP